MTTTTDEEILSLFREQSTKSNGFTLLMNKYNERIYWHIRRLVVSHDDAQDILQETFINVYNGLDGFAGDSGLYTWLYRIATNECLRLFRNRKKFLVSEKEVNKKLINQLYESSAIDAEEILLKFQEAILRLPEKQQLVFNMRYYDELTYEEISQVLNSSVATLKTNYHYASSRIKEYMLKDS
ncbi:RNA polymerase sigma factor [Pontibacter liquoris]|uniref:RNA polymerase sigma factor n=1 Tax=Pontibacter liquoris TaxID=2905677 RepID=UPI001FA72B6A|nr:RNA polymerase sigma factor [Pontibacter liquoris]